MYASVDMPEDPKINMMHHFMEVNKIMNERVMEPQLKQYILNETSQIRNTPWETYHYPDNTLVLYQDDSMIYNLFSIVRCVFPTTVIIPALYDTIQDFKAENV